MSRDGHGSRGVVGAALVAAAIAVVAVWSLEDSGPPPPRAPGDEPAGGVVAAEGPVPMVVSTLPGRAGWTAGWNSTAFIQDNLWTAGGHQWAVWTDAEGAPVVARRELPDGPWSATDLGAVPDNPLGAPTVEDGHRTYAVAVDAGGGAHVAGNVHSGRLRYVRSSPEDPLRTWRAGTMVGSEEASVTYPRFVVHDGGLLFLYREGGAGDGATVMNRLPPGSETWQRVGVILDGRADGASPYLHHVAVDDEDRIHLMFLWRRGPEPTGNGRLSYLSSDDGGATWRSAAGDVVTTPVTPGGSELVDLDMPGGLVPLNSGGLAVDGDGRPHGFFRLRGPERTVPELLHVHWDGRRWRGGTVATHGPVSGRPAALTVDGEVFLLWTERHPDGTGTLWLTPASPEAAGGWPLARLAWAGWEPSFDTNAARDRGELHVLVPVERVATGGGSDAQVTGRAAVVSHDLRAVVAAPPRTSGRGRRDGRRPRCSRRPAHAQRPADAQRRSSASVARPRRTMVWPASSRNVAR